MHAHSTVKSEQVLASLHPEVRTMRLLITGATGFVGKALCEAANHFGAHVRAASRQSFDFGACIENSVIPDLGGIGNLYIAGTSVLPTGSSSNPSYTALALAFRTAQHILAKL